MKFRISILIAVLVIGVLNNSCKPDDPPPPTDEEINTELLSKPWIPASGANAITVATSDVSDLWSAFVLTMGDKTYSSTGADAPEVWPASGTWSFKADDANTLVRNDGIEIAKVIRKPYFVPDSKKIDTLLREFKRRRVHIAVSVDEYGGVSGIVCMEDIIEEIVGDIQDEFDNEVEDVIEIGQGTFLCDARVDIEDLNETTGLTISDEDFDTLGGFVFDIFGKIPVRFEKVNTPEAEFIIQEMDGHKIKTIKIILKDTMDE